LDTRFGKPVGPDCGCRLPITGLAFGGTKAVVLNVTVVDATANRLLSVYLGGTVRPGTHETLLDPDDVAAGHVVRFRRSRPDRIVRSRRPAHPEIVSVELFTEVQLLRRSRAAGGLPARRKLERGPKATKRPYPLRGRVRCGYCSRRMEGTPRETRTYYRGATRTMVPGSLALVGHPKNVYLPEAAVLVPLNKWLDGLFDRVNVDRTVAALVASQDVGQGAGQRDAAKRRLSEAEARLRRLQEAIVAGVDPAGLVEAVNEAQAQRAASRAEVENAPASGGIDAAEVYAMIDSLGEVKQKLSRADPAQLEDLYEKLRLEMIYDAEARAVDVTIQPTRRGSKCVRGRSCTLTTRLVLCDTA
jgi:hypothetical protein